ncbi:MAG: phosphoribosylanthranilate isomerase [Chloroflexi bacterium]|nr:phosphoribosylanthranilate isomerase [Chloroflexota bacterium]MYC02822.1 phosphoribosylanthranilate isomerase [Chloroflexota bacterium]
MTFVKVCSVRAVEHAVWAREAGADEIGMIFADAPRRIDLKAARAVRRELGPRVEIAEATTETVERERHDANQPLLVGVFAGQSVDEIERVLDQVDLDLVQLSGGEHPALAGRIRRAVVRVIHVADGMDAGSVLREIDRAPNTITMLDAKSKQGGGMGQRIDWSIAAEVASNRPLVLAGGLNPDNVAEAVRAVRPWAVDASSGLETDGTKDREKIRAFVAAAKAEDVS